MKKVVKHYKVFVTVHYSMHKVYGKVYENKAMLIYAVSVRVREREIHRRVGLTKWVLCSSELVMDDNHSKL